MTVIYCKCCNASLIAPQILDAVQECLNQSPRQVYCVDDLCALAAKQDQRLKEWAGSESLTVLACFPRAIQALFAHAHITPPEKTQYINLRAMQTAEQVKEAFDDIDQTQPGRCAEIKVTDPNWQPWFPTIDYDRCKNCKQCLNFCLFGVYTLKEGCVEVTQPDKCKTGCPACARVCPYAAIIFPKYDKSPINGAQVDESKWKQDHAESSESLKDRLSGNIYQILKNRGKSDANPQSLADLEKLKDQFDIPDQVFDAENDSFSPFS
ncbi:MAG: ATP-binding protein [Planctomycetota bacterium]|jgi:NAD-dependent dihydropyrimidine dehydrogenase PreA subunit